MTTAPHCSYCGIEFTQANLPVTPEGECNDAWNCVRRHWDALVAEEKQKEAKDAGSQAELR